MHHLTILGSQPKQIKQSHNNQYYHDEIHHFLSALVHVNVDLVILNSTSRNLVRAT